jgi:hypothetical protein
LFLLAVDTGTPGAWEPLRRLLATEKTGGRTWSNEKALGDALAKQAPAPGETAPADLERVVAWLKAPERKPFFCDEEELEEWLGRVARFSFAR